MHCVTLRDKPLITKSKQIDTQIPPFLIWSVKVVMLLILIWTPLSLGQTKVYTFIGEGENGGNLRLLITIPSTIPRPNKAITNCTLRRP
jgi:hypothetical protein